MILVAWATVVIGVQVTFVHVAEFPAPEEPPVGRPPQQETQVEDDGTTVYL